MTNREYMENLSDKELVTFLGNKPWVDYCNEMFYEWGLDFDEALEEWLSLEYVKE